MTHDLIQKAIDTLKKSGVQYVSTEGVLNTLNAIIRPELTKPEILLQRFKEKPRLLNIVAVNEALAFLLEPKIAEEKANVQTLDQAAITKLLTFSLNEQIVIRHALDFYLQRNVPGVEKRAIAENLVKRLNS